MRNNNNYKYLMLVTFFIGSYFVNAQDPLRFTDEVDILISKDFGFSPNDSIILFTGSSSIRMWSDIQDYFQEYNIVNTGFGGSHMSDLLYYSSELIFKHSPTKVFIYEGDNDIAVHKNPNEILKTTDSLISLIKNHIPNVEIYIISAKPSLARWSLKKEYIELNHLFKDYCNNYSKITFINIWDIMLNENEKPRKDSFIEDGLHMNKTGYDLWAEKIKEFL